MLIIFFIWFNLLLMLSSQNSKLHPLRQPHLSSRPYQSLNPSFLNPSFQHTLPQSQREQPLPTWDHISYHCSHPTQNEIRLINVLVLGKLAFTTASKDGKTLKPILEDPRIPRYTQDVRNDFDAFKLSIISALLVSLKSKYSRTRLAQATSNMYADWINACN
jgi:hypothetical protein